MTNSTRKINKNINLDVDVLKEIDMRRGLAKRSTYVNFILRDSLFGGAGQSDISSKEMTA